MTSPQKCQILDATSSLWLWHNMKSWTHLNRYFKYTCTLKLKLYNYLKVFVSIYFWKIRKAEFALKCLHFFLDVKQSPPFKMEKTKELLFTVFWEKHYIEKNEHTLSYKIFFSLWIRNWCMQRDEKTLKYSMSLKSCYSRQLLFSLVFILSHTVRFLLDLINQYYSLFTTKFINMLKALETKTNNFN